MEGGAFLKATRFCRTAARLLMQASRCCSETAHRLRHRQAVETT